MEDSERFGFPASFAQERIWFIEQLLPGSPVFNVSVALRLPTAIDQSALQKSIDVLARRHDSLRTHLELIGDELTQVVCGEVNLPLSVLDVVSNEPWPKNTEAITMLRDRSAVPFKLGTGPLIRLALFRRNSGHHLLHIVMHHSITDGWSLRVLIDELMTLYRSFVTGLPARLPELPIQYADYAVWQRRQMQGPTLAPLLDYWRDRLRGVPDLALPTDRPHPEIPSLRGGRCLVRITEDQLRGIDGLARQHGTTRFAIVLATFQLLLYRYSGQTRFTIGTVIANRERRELELLIGFFANTLVLPADLRGTPDFSNLIDRVHNETLGALEHQQLPFEKLVEALQPQRNLARNPLFQVLFILQNSAAIGSHSDDQLLETLEVDTGVSNFDLSFDLWPADRGLEGRFEYSLDLFDATTIERMVRHFNILLSAAIAQPGRSIALLDMFSQGERETLYKAARSAYPPTPPACIHNLVTAQAQLTPDAIAVIDGPTKLSYRDLDDKASRLATALSGYGVGKACYAAVILNGSHDFIVTILAILKTGGVYVPLSPAWPARHLDDVLAALDPRVIILHSCNDYRPQSRATVLTVDSPDLWSKEPFTGSIESDPDTPAYVIYTSGSTGTPKGVVVPHRAIANHLAWVQRMLTLGSDDRVLQLASPTFDVSVWEIFGPLASGATVLIPQDRHDPRSISAFIIDNNITILQLVPSYLRELLDLGGLDTPALRAVFCGGEAMPEELHDQFLKQCGATLFNAYGPTETTIDATVWRCDKGLHRNRVPIGFPIDGTCAHVVGPERLLCPTGVPGELWVGGAGVALGYLGAPELTEQRFPDNPFNPDGGRMYRTGDRVRRLENGELEWLGRLDRQVKINGLRIELEEVEAALRSLSAVGDAAVVTHTRADGGQALIAYYVGTAGQPSPNAAELRRGLRRLLLQGAIPGAFIRVDSLARAESGKVDYQLLSRLPTQQDPRHLRPPSGPIEMGLATIWERLLDVSPIDADDDFFALGGHSLLVARVVARVLDAFAVELPMRLMFEAPTIAELAPHIAARLGSGEVDEIARQPPPDLNILDMDPQAVDKLSGEQVDDLLDQLLDTGNNAR